MAQLHALVGYCPGQDDEDAEVLIETDRGPWVAAGYLVFAVDTLQAARFSERHQVPGPRATPGTRTCWRRWCAPMPTGCGRRPGTARPRGIKVLARAQDADLGTGPAGPAAAGVIPGRFGGFGDDLGVSDALGLLAKAPEPEKAAKLTRAHVSTALKRAGRRNITGRATAVLAASRSEQLGQPAVLVLACAAAVRSLTAVIVTLNEQVKSLQCEVGAHLAGTGTLRSPCPSRPGPVPRRPGARRVRRRPAPLPRRQGRGDYP